MVEAGTTLAELNDQQQEKHPVTPNILADIAGEFISVFKQQRPSDQKTEYRDRYQGVTVVPSGPEAEAAVLAALQAAGVDFTSERSEAAGDHVSPIVLQVIKSIENAPTGTDTNWFDRLKTRISPPASQLPAEVSFNFAPPSRKDRKPSTPEPYYIVATNGNEITVHDPDGMHKDDMPGDLLSVLSPEFWASEPPSDEPLEVDFKSGIF